MQFSSGIHHIGLNLHITRDTMRCHSEHFPYASPLIIVVANNSIIFKRILEKLRHSMTTKLQSRQKEFAVHPAMASKLRSDWSVAIMSLQYRPRKNGTRGDKWVRMSEVGVTSCII